MCAGVSTLHVREAKRGSRRRQMGHVGGDGAPDGPFSSTSQIEPARTREQRGSSVAPTTVCDSVYLSGGFLPG